MPKESTAESLLDAFEDLLIVGGAKAASLDAIARRVGLSKAGLLHHFHSKALLIEGLVSRLDALVDEDVTKMLARPDQAASYYILSSLDTDQPLERTISAVSRLAQAGDDRARAALRSCRERWYQALCDVLSDRVLAKLVLFAGDGMSYNVDMSGGVQDDAFVNRASIEQVVQLISSLR